MTEPKEEQEGIGPIQTSATFGLSSVDLKLGAEKAKPPQETARYEIANAGREPSLSDGGELPTLVEPPPISSGTLQPDPAADKRLTEAQNKSDDRRRSDNLRFDKEFSTPFGKATPLPDGGFKLDKPGYFETNLPPPLPIDPHQKPTLHAETQANGAPTPIIQNDHGSAGGSAVVGAVVLGAVVARGVELAREHDLEATAGKVLDLVDKGIKAWDQQQSSAEKKISSVKQTYGEFEKTAKEFAGHGMELMKEAVTKVGEAYDEAKPKVEAFAERTATQIEEAYQAAKPFAADAAEGMKSIGAGATAGADRAFEAVKDGVVAVFEQVAAATAPEHEFDLEDYPLKAAPPAAEPPAEKPSKSNEQQL